MSLSYKLSSLAREWILSAGPPLHNTMDVTMSDWRTTLPPQCDHSPEDIDNYEIPAGGRRVGLLWSFATFTCPILLSPGWEDRMHDGHPHKMNKKSKHHDDGECIAADFVNPHSSSIAHPSHEISRPERKKRPRRKRDLCALHWVNCIFTSFWCHDLRVYLFL